MDNANLLDPQGQSDNAPGSGLPPLPSSEASDNKAPWGTTFEELAAKKGFQSPEDLAKAYMNLESQNKKVEMSLSDILKAKEEGINHAPQEDHFASMSEPVEDEQKKALRLVENMIQKNLRPLQDKLDLQDCMNRHPDASKYANAMAELIRQNPNLRWEEAYKLARYQDLEQDARLQGAKEATERMQNKEAVESVHSSSRLAQWTPELVQRAIVEKKITLAQARELLARAGQ